MAQKNYLIRIVKGAAKCILFVFVKPRLKIQMNRVIGKQIAFSLTSELISI
jgi:hypothetical protein